MDFFKALSRPISVRPDVDRGNQCHRTAHATQFKTQVRNVRSVRMHCNPMYTHMGDGCAQDSLWSLLLGPSFQFLALSTPQHCRTVRIRKRHRKEIDSCRAI